MDIKDYLEEPEKKKALIVHVGNKYTRALKSIEKVEPDLVYFIYSKSHEKYMNIIINESPFNYEVKTKLIKDFQSINESYIKSKEIFKELKDDYDIHVGVSNGTKAMVVGLSLASVGYDCEFSYVGSVKGGRDEKGEVIEGGEKVFDEFHPMKQLATIEINRAKRYFNDYQFSQSLHYFKKARDSLYNTERMNMYIKIVELYTYWDKFENMIPYINKKNELSSAQLGFYLQSQIQNEINNNQSLKEYFYKHEADFMNQIDKNIMFLNKKISRDGLIKEGDIYYYLPDLLNNAQRRIKEKKFDDATARLYRVAELISQIRLYEHGLIEKKRLETKVFHIEKENVVRNYPINVIEYISKNRDFQNSERKTVRLALMEDYEVLKILGDDLAVKFLEDKDLNNALSNRNSSILAHGLIPANEDSVNLLYDKLVNYSRETFDELDEFIEYSKFPKFNDIYD